jgi:multidrug efflux pump subunit AcrB
LPTATRAALLALLAWQGSPRRGRQLCIMFGLSFACVLTMIVRPVLYAIMYHVPAKGLPAAKSP